jgi:hypothetical protein
LSIYTSNPGISKVIVEGTLVRRMGFPAAAARATSGDATAELKIRRTVAAKVRNFILKRLR